VVELCFASQIFQSEFTHLSIVPSVNFNEGTCYNKSSLRIATKDESVGIIRHLCREWINLFFKQLKYEPVRIVPLTEGISYSLY
jgi:hypothetical protein